MTSEERLMLEKTISNELEDLSTEQRQSILRDLSLDKLTGEALTRAVLSAGGPLASMATLSTGFGTYLALTTVIHAVATTALGITLPFAVYTTATSALSLLTGPVGWVIGGAGMLASWSRSDRKLSRSVFAGLVAASADFLLLPTQYVPPSTVLDPVTTDVSSDAANKMQTSTKEADAAAKNAAEQIETLSSRLKLAEYAQAKALESVAATQTKINFSGISTEELNKVRMDMEAAEALAYVEMERAERYKMELSSLRLERDRLQVEALRLKSRSDSFEEGEASKLLELWSIHYPRMQFDRQPVRWVIRRRYQERLSFERKLMELHGSDDPVALSLGKMRVNNEHHLPFRINTVECRMYYRVNGSKIIVTELGTNQETH